MPSLQISVTNNMEEKLKIKLSIVDRVYPLTIDPKQEEGLRKAAKNIENLAKKFEQNYAVRDKQDVLAMCALQFASKIEQGGIDRFRKYQGSLGAPKSVG